MNKLKPYPTYKDSGVEWIGEIPEGWEVKKIKHIAQLNPSRKGLPHFAADTLVSFLPMECVGTDWNNTPQTKHFSTVCSGYTCFKDGDILVAKITPCFENGKGTVAHLLRNGVGFGSTEFHVIRTPNRISLFLSYILRTREFIQLGIQEMTGVAGQQRIPESFISFFKVPLPSLSEQQAIATFLDKETARIDELVEKKTRAVELLREKRQAMITQAVTKGLDPNAKMKDSGVEWIGEIPEGWEISPLKHKTKQIIDGTHFRPTYIADGVNFLRVTDISLLQSINSEIDWDSVAKISFDEHKQLSKRCCVEQGDLLVSKNGTIGIPKVVDWDRPTSIFVSLCLIKTFDKYASSFLYYYFKSSLPEMEIIFGGKTGTITNLHLEMIKEFKIPFPPRHVQKNIVEHLNQRCSLLDSLIAKIERSIELLKEQRQALITAAVTGKIDVRGFAPQAVFEDVSQSSLQADSAGKSKTRVKANSKALSASHSEVI